MYILLHAKIFNKLELYVGEILGDYKAGFRKEHFNDRLDMLVVA